MEHQTAPANQPTRQHPVATETSRILVRTAQTLACIYIGFAMISLIAPLFGLSGTNIPAQIVSTTQTETLTDPDSAIYITPADDDQPTLPAFITASDAPTTIALLNAGSITLNIVCWGTLIILVGEVFLKTMEGNPFDKRNINNLRLAAGTMGILALTGQNLLHLASTATINHYHLASPGVQPVPAGFALTPALVALTCLAVASAFTLGRKYQADTEGLV